MIETAPKVQLWTRDLGSCLHATLATVLLHDGHDPVTVLGAPWEFRRRAGAWTTEEYYFHAEPDSLAKRLALFHPFESTWHRSDRSDGSDCGDRGDRGDGSDGSHRGARGDRGGAGDGLDELRDALAAGVLPIAAVDNFHLPFRPAFHDVHAAHLLVVYRITDTDVYVSDAQPPAFQGPIPVADFLRGWDSANPAQDADVFFSSSPSDRRWLHARMRGEQPETDRGWLAHVIRDNVARYRQASTAGTQIGTQSGAEGLRQYLDELCALRPGSDVADLALSELYVISWNIQAQAGLHAEFLRAQALYWQLPDLAEAAARVDAVAHGWTGVRMTGAHSRVWQRHRFDELRGHSAELLRRLAVALDQLDRTADAVSRQA